MVQPPTEPHGGDIPTWNDTTCVEGDDDSDIDLNYLDDDPIKKKKASDTETFNAAMAAIKAMQEKKEASKVADKVTFAGQSYDIERSKTQKDVRKE